MELKDYLRILRRNGIIVVACSLLGLLVAGAVSLLLKPTYTSATKLFVALQSSGSVTELQQGNVFTQARVQSYVQTVRTPTVLQPVIDSLGLDERPESLAKRVEATSDVDTVLINISVTSESPVQAAAIAQAIGSSLITAVDNLERTSRGDTPVRLSIITPATAPTSPASPNVQLNLFLGLLLGVVTGMGVSLLRNAVDTRIRGEADFKGVANIAMLGRIGFEADAANKPLLTQIPAQSPRAESFRQLRTNLQFANISRESKTVLITSSVPGEGKSTTAINLAIAMAQAGQTVALVDADLRRPMVAEYLGLERSVGLTTALIGEAHVGDLFQKWGDDELYVLASGQIPPNPSELLGSGKMSQLLATLEGIFDAVVIDAPPILPVTDAAVLAQQVGGVVLIVGAQKVRTTDVEKSMNALEMVNARLMGAVLNRLPMKGPDAYKYQYGTYEGKPVETLPEASLPESRLPDAVAEPVPHFEQVSRRDFREPTRLTNISRTRSVDQ